MDVDDFFFLRDACEGLEGDSDFFEGGVGGMELAEAAVYKDQAGEGLLFFHEALVSGGE